MAQEDEQATSPELSHNKALFTDEAGFRIAFFLHKSIKKGSRPALIEDIENHGGCIINTDEGADTVLVAKDLSKTKLQASYSAHSNAKLRKVFVEPSTFIQRCINENQFYHHHKVQGMGGRAGARIPFTEDEDHKICEYLSRILPNKESGGRLGLKVYKTLMDCAELNPVEYEWAKRHTAESWKQRYKMFAPQFDKRISQLAKANPSVEYAWPEDRRMGHERLRRVIELDSDGEELEEQAPGDDDEEEYVPASPPKRQRSRRSAKRARILSEEVEGEEGQVPRTDDEEEYVPASPPKRRRSGRSDLPPAKRARASSQPHNDSQRQRPSATSNGKEKAVEDEEWDAEFAQEGTSLFSRGDLDLSGDFPSPVHTFEDDGHAMHPSREYPTQNTLVETASHGDPSKVASTSGNRARDGDLFPQPTNQRIVPPRSPEPHPRPQSSVYVDLRSPPVHRKRGSQPQLQSSSLRASPEPLKPTPPTPPPAQPSNVYRRPVKAARRPPELIQAVVQETSGPYRNTRSRSRSVEPPPVMPPVGKRQKGRKDNLKQADVIPEEVVEEGILVEETIAPIGETLAEERNTADLLGAGNEASIIASRRRSMESDDAQIAQSLREGSTATSHVAPAKGFSSRLPHPEDFLRQMAMLPSHSRRSMPFNFQVPFGKISPALPPNEVLHHRSRASEPLGLRRGTPGTFKTPDPHTPQQRVRRSPASISSAESFPLSGTRASAYKKRLRQMEKSSPYKPPAGTRAAELAKNIRNFS